MPDQGAAATLLTVGHSNHPLVDFLEICAAHGVEQIVDVRRFPGSRKHPHFGAEPLAHSLAAAGIRYDHRPDLGGRRSLPRAAASTSPWRVAAFAAYAAYMLTPPFRAAMEDLLALAARRRTAIMCAEAFPYSCHRRLIADWATLHAWTVEHLLTRTRREPHRPMPLAHREGNDVVYGA